ncbi:MAG TPA: hypothetical protein VFU80_00110 [Sphingomicrobium sp.]|nr:hypothetical protein [Sphingomicrobium sp.]
MAAVLRLAGFAAAFRAVVPLAFFAALLRFAAVRRLVVDRFAFGFARVDVDRVVVLRADAVEVPALALPSIDH